MGLIHKKVLGVSITINSKVKILEYIEKYLTETRNSKLEIRKKGIKPLVIFTPNPEIIVYSQKDKDFQDLVNSAQINIPDGAGTGWALEKLYKLKIKRLTGIDLMEKLCRLAAEKRFRVGVIGGKGRVALEALECLQNTYAKLIIEVLGVPEIDLRFSNNEFEFRSKINDYKNITSSNKNHKSLLIIRNSKSNKKIDKDFYFQNLVKEIINNKIDILFVGLGFPKQEYFIDSVARLTSSVKLEKPLVMMAVGGAFDYISGRVPRAPQWMRDRGLEWLYRLVREPWRIKRQLLGARFYFDILRYGS